MAEIYIYTLLSVLAVSLISLVGIFTLSLNESLVRKYVFLLISLAIGALLGDALIHLIPESFEELSATLAGLLVISGIFLFFVLEKVLHWHHAHGLSEEMHALECEEIDDTIKSDGTIRPIGKMILISDGIHNFLDGIIIAAGYFISIEVGIATTIAVILHEIPQEIGDFGVLLHAGYTKVRALFLNFLSALLAVAGAAVTLILGEVAEPIIGYAIPVVAGAFIYIAASDLIPELHKTKKIEHSLLQLVAIAVGVAAMALLVLFEAV